MNNPAKSIFLYSFYMIGMGLGLLFVPDMVITLFGFETTHEVWIRILGLFSIVTGIYYVEAARHNLVSFFKISIAGRFLFALGLITFVILGLSKPALIVFAIIESSGAIWTCLTLRSIK